MQKQKRWQFFLILAVIILTVFNILPTVFFYTKPLKKSIEEKEAKEVVQEIAKRVNVLEKESISWIGSFCKLLNVKPQSILSDSSDPQRINILFSKEEDATLFKKQLPRAGSLIAFVPSQLFLGEEEENPRAIIVKRQLSIQLPLPSIDSFFSFSKKWEVAGKATPLFQEILFDRTAEIALAAGGESENAFMVSSILFQPHSFSSRDLVFALANNLFSFLQVFDANSSIAQRYFASFTQSNSSNRRKDIESLLSSFDYFRDEIKLKRVQIQENEKKAKEQKTFIKEEDKNELKVLEREENLLIKAKALIQQHMGAFSRGKTPWTYASLQQNLQEAAKKNEAFISLEMGDRNPFIQEIFLDWANEKILLKLHEDVLTKKKLLSSLQKDQWEQLLINEMAAISRLCDENLSPHGDEFSITLTQLPNSKSFSTLKLSEIARQEIERIQKLLQKEWHPKHPELSKENFPIWDYETFRKLPLEQKRFGLLLFSPTLDAPTPPKGMKGNSIYIIAKGLYRILQKYEKQEPSEESRQFTQDFQTLEKLLKDNGFLGYSGASLPISVDLRGDFLFEHDNFYNTLILATREKFTVHGTKRFAVLEYTDVEQRILTLNEIETKIHEDLLKWKDDYNAMRVSLNPATKYDVPAPAQNALWSNIVLSTAKYFRGDDRKILHWGLDLSGGKTVQIELRDQNNHVVKNEQDLKQGVNELYNRVNKMGVSEVNIRVVGSNIVLDFPGSQGLSAAELVKASSMFFHVVNEKFSTNNPELANHISRFLQEVWNEALVTNRKDIESINTIAYRHLYGDIANGEIAQPRSEAAKILYDSGLRLTSPYDETTGSAFNDSLSKIAIFRGKDFLQWQGQTHPLLIVFKNYSLEGPSLTNIHASYDPSKGNFLSFEIKSSLVHKDGLKTNPREELYAWTSHFSKEKISNTPLENYSKGRGWRMAVILNDSIISAPALESALRDNAMITGSFSQREVNQLVADLKAGSLSFTPRILTEKNVSPELGLKERTQGIVATFVALFHVIGAMILYYRFAGIVASCAVLFNLLILWATLQNLQATLTLAGIAGILLTVAMAVDANVLVFERIREEFALTGRIASAIQAGYRKAFSAIIDSNITTIIAALVLLNFDSGPIKGFAVTLIIGIVSSLFSALFMTRYFFMGWVQNPEHKEFKMCHWIKTTHIDFLKKAKPAFLFSLVIIFVGGAFLFMEKKSILGMDFTGGFSLNIELQEKASSIHYRQLVEKALEQKGAYPQDFQVRELNPSNNLRILFGVGMEEKGRPFYLLPLETPFEGDFAFQKNPRLVWIVEALQKANLPLKQKSLEQLDKTWTAMSGQMSDSMRNNALLGLAFALICVFIYITFRFEFKYATSAILCLIHDAFITLGMIGFLHTLGVPVQIDMHTVAALMTIIGYSLNDTIIIFDRIREDVKLMRRQSLTEVVNHALNVTLSRTTITSGITLLVLLILVFLGGSTLFGFALVMTLGVLFGTLSSIFIASPLMLLLHKREEKKYLENL